MKEENVKSEYQRKVDKSLIPTCNIMGVNIAAINMNWLLKYIDAEYGYCLNTLHSYTFEGSAGFEKMQNIMVSFRKSITEFAGKKVLKCLDYS